MTPTWPDLVILAILLFATLKGLKRGFLRELAGALALICAFFAPFWYNGAADEPLAQLLRLPSYVAHLVALALVGILAYVLVVAIATVLTRLVHLSPFGFVNKMLGALVGFAKSAVFVWAILYVALFFPLGAGIRSDLHHSVLASAATSVNAKLDSAVQSVLPWFVRPLSNPLFERHRS